MNLKSLFCRRRWREKDRAENLMIIDLLRNDIGKVSRVGSVRVPKLFHLERHTSVWRLVSIVCGELRPGLDAVDLLRACFPGGSVTGCPKTRAMEIIEELEPVRRGVPSRRDLLPEPESKPSLVIHAQPFADYPAELYAPGIRAITSCIPRNERSPLTKVKALSYLDNVLARREAGARGVDEALLSHTAGHLVCASAANLFTRARRRLGHTEGRIGSSSPPYWPRK